MFNQLRIPLTKKTGGFPGELETRVSSFLRDQVRSVKQSLDNLYNQRVIKWRKNYEGIPVEATREFPFHNASNLVVPIIAIHSDTLLARVMSAIIKTQPPWNARIVAGAMGNPKLQDASSALETFLSYVAYEPSELDLLRVYHEWMGETIRYGTSTLKCPIIREMEDYVLPGDGSGTGSPVFDTRVKYEGPRPEKIRFSDFGINPSAKTIDSANFKYHCIHLQKDDLEYRAYRGLYDKDAVEKIKNTPDRTTPDRVRQSQEQDAGVKTPSGYGWGEWDIHECWFRFRFDSQHYVKGIVWYHEKTNTILRLVYSGYPDDPFIGARLFYRDDAYHGYGFCEMLEPIADELSTMHNQRRDNVTVCTTKFFLVDPDSKLHEGYRIFPSAMLPGLKDEFEAIDMGQPASITIDEERMSLELADKRTGVSAPIQGTGSGFNTKRGIYTAMGTLSILQEGNTRTDLNITDMRDAHTRLGRMLCSQYKIAGLGDRAAQFGELTGKIEAALDAMAAGQVVLPITASTSSLNREVEKQNDIMISNLLNNHYARVTQMLQSAFQYMQDPRIGEDAKKAVGGYTIKAINGADFMMKSIMRHFGYDEVDRLVPDALPTGVGASATGGGTPAPTGGPSSQAPGPKGSGPGVSAPLSMPGQVM